MAASTLIRALALALLVATASAGQASRRPLLKKLSGNVTELTKEQRREQKQNPGRKARRNTATKLPAGLSSQRGVNRNAIVSSPAAPKEWASLLRLMSRWSYQYSSWDPLQPCSTWEDIECDNAGHVTEIDISGGIYLNGVLGPEIGNLTFLRYFYAVDELLSGSLPTTLGRLLTLSYINLDTNQLVGNVPTQLSSMIFLTYLSMVENTFSGTFPGSLGKLAILQELYLEYNQFTGIGEIGGMASLGSLNVYYNLVNCLPTSISKMGSLTEIYAYNNRLPNLPSELGKLTAVTFMDFSYNNFTRTPSWISVLPALDYLYFNFNFIQGSGIATPAGVAAWDFTFNYLTSGFCYDNNCQGTCNNQRTPEACARFCGSNEPTGPCGGKGTCWNSLPIPRCRCNSGREVCYANNQCTCV